MSRFKIGDRVEIADGMEAQFKSRVGIILAKAVEPAEGRNLTVRLADGTESVFADSQLKIPPVMFADMIVDTQVSPVLRGLRGSTLDRNLRFVSREFDIDLKLGHVQGQSHLIGQLSANEVASETALVTLLTKDAPYATTTTDTLGEFEFHQVPAGNMTLEILVPTRRILSKFRV